MVRIKKDFQGKKRKSTNKEMMVALRLTSEEYDLLLNKAKEENMSKSEYLRYLITQKAVNHAEVSSAVNKLIYEVNRIGNNINQIARLANSGEMRFVDQDRLESLLDQILDQVEKAVIALGN